MVARFIQNPQTERGSASTASCTWGCQLARTLIDAEPTGFRGRSLLPNVGQNCCRARSWPANGGCAGIDGENRRRKPPTNPMCAGEYPLGRSQLADVQLKYGDPLGMEARLTRWSIFSKWRRFQCFASDASADIEIRPEMGYSPYAARRMRGWARSAITRTGASRCPRPHLDYLP